MISTSLVQKLIAAKQEHVLQFYNNGELTTEQAQELVSQLESWNFEDLNELFHNTTNKQITQSIKDDVYEPFDAINLIESRSNEEKERWTNLGMDAIQQCKVCAVILGGGQGTRLGFSGPKGMYNIGLPSEKSLYQLFAERIRKLQYLADKVASSASGNSSAIIPLYIMTSTQNHEATTSFFHENDFFGLREDQVFFFSQGVLPCFTREGKLMLESTFQLATASDGNGGVYEALLRSKAIEKMKKDKVEYLHIFSVDNALCKVADPLFIGYCIEKNADCGNKVVMKSSPTERVGVLAKKNGSCCIIEYSEMDAKMAEAIDPSTGKLQYGGANICSHFFTLDFIVETILPNSKLSYHVAEKKIPYVNEHGDTITPTSNSGIKLESFIFDVFPLSSRMAVFEVDREYEFAPVKNAPGNPVDSPDSARRMIMEESRSWLKNIANKMANSKAIDLVVIDKISSCNSIEVSPLLSYRGEDLETCLLEFDSIMQQNDSIQLCSHLLTANYSSITSSLRKELELANQLDVLRFVKNKQLTESQALKLELSLKTWDLSSLEPILSYATTPSIEENSESKIEPIEATKVDMLEDVETSTKDEWWKLGLDAISKGIVAALVLAGGQGTRLGFDGPKGMFDIGLPSHKSLFELFALRIRKLQELAHALAASNAHSSDDSSLKCRLPFLIMTSQMNHNQTIEFFHMNNYFGLHADQVHFFVQGTLPCFSMEGTILMEAADLPARASDGNGGVYEALRKSGTLNLLIRQQIQFIHIFSVDNALCKVADPVLVGYSIATGADCANKVVWKSTPNEKVGVFAKRNGVVGVIEYSELSNSAAEETDKSTGRLLYGAANICNHLFHINFLETCCNNKLLPYHVARKIIPTIGDTPNSTTKVPGIKLEQFIFDVFPHSQKFRILAVSREEEFAPVKNAEAEGVNDSPATARALVSQLCRKWLTDAGIDLSENKDAIYEILPTVSYHGEGLDPSKSEILSTCK